MNRKETWYLLIALALVIGVVYFMEFNNSNNSASSAGTTPTLGPVWTIAENTVQSVRFEDLKSGLYVDLQNNAGKWVLASYALVTPSLTPTSTNTATPKGTATATLAAGVTPTSTSTPTETATATSTLTPTATLEVSLTPSLPPTQEADVQAWPYVLEYLRTLRPVQSLGDNLQPQDFGLDKPNYKLTLTMTDGKVGTLLIGASAPVKSAGYYAQVAGTKTIVLLQADLVDSLVSFLSHPPVQATPTPAVTNTATAESTATSLPTQTPTATIVAPTATVAAPTDTPVVTATAS
jgi:hypothetical protein